MESVVAKVVSLTGSRITWETDFWACPEHFQNISKHFHQLERKY